MPAAGERGADAVGIALKFRRDRQCEDLILEDGAQRVGRESLATDTELIEHAITVDQDIHWRLSVDAPDHCKHVHEREQPRIGLDAERIAVRHGVAESHKGEWFNVSAVDADLQGTK